MFVCTEEEQGVRFVCGPIEDVSSKLWVTVICNHGNVKGNRVRLRTVDNFMGICDVEIFSERIK